MKSRLFPLLLLMVFLFSACSAPAEDTTLETLSSDTTSAIGYVFDKEAVCADVKYKIDSRWETKDSNSSGDEYTLFENAALHLWYEEPLRGKTAEDTLMEDTEHFSTMVDNNIFTDEVFEFHSEKARRREMYSTTTIHGYQNESYSESISFIRHDKVFHITITCEGTDENQLLCHEIIEDVFSTISFTGTD